MHVPPLLLHWRVRIVDDIHQWAGSWTELDHFVWTTKRCSPMDRNLSTPVIWSCQGNSHLSYNQWGIPLVSGKTLNRTQCTIQHTNHSANSLHHRFLPLFHFQINNSCFACGYGSLPVCVLLTKVFLETNWLTESLSDHVECDPIQVTSWINHKHWEQTSTTFWTLDSKGRIN